MAPVPADLPPGPTVVLVDHGSVEVFAAGGLVTLTDLVMDAPGAETVRVELVRGSHSPSTTPATRVDYSATRIRRRLP